MHVARAEASLDPLLFVFSGVVDENDLSGGHDPNQIDSGDPGYIGAADDNTPAPPGLEGPWADPAVTFTAATSGLYTAVVTSNGSGSPGGDGVYGYNIFVS